MQFSPWKLSKLQAKTSLQGCKRMRDHRHWQARDTLWNLAKPATEAILGLMIWAISWRRADHEGGPHYLSCIHEEGNPGSYKRGTPGCRKMQAQSQNLCVLTTNEWVIAIDLLTLHGYDHLLVCDYYSKSPIVRHIPLGQATSPIIVGMLKQILLLLKVPDCTTSLWGRPLAQSLLECSNKSDHYSKSPTVRHIPLGQATSPIIVGMLKKPYYYSKFPIVRRIPMGQATSSIIVGMFCSNKSLLSMAPQNGSSVTIAMYMTQHVSAHSL